MGQAVISTDNQRRRVTHYGEARFGNTSAECAVLDDGRRGYIMRGLHRAVGMKGNIALLRFRRFLRNVAPNALELLDNTASQVEVKLPHGGNAIWVSEGILTELASGIIETALDRKLRDDQAHLVAPCRAIMKALAVTGERGLIDEATGYQYHRAPDALQDLFSRLIRETASDWDIRFRPDFYKAICDLFGFTYSIHRALPPIVGKITQDWVYEVIFPVEMIAEIKARKKSEKMHQWLEESGIKLLERQRDAVMTIARTSVDFKDFEARCSVAFHRPGQQVKMNFPTAA